ncbi:MAG: hypothetical protein ABI746_12040 [Dermatophilaceae bacterium]
MADDSMPPHSDRATVAKLRRFNLVLLVGALLCVIAAAVVALLGGIEDPSRGWLLAGIFALLALRSALRLRSLRRDDATSPR